MLVGVVDVGVGDDHVKLFNATLPVGDVVFDVGFLTLHFNRCNRCRQADFSTQFLKQLHQRADKCVGAALGEIDAPFSLEEVNECID